MSGFGDGFLSSDRDFELLAQAFMVGQGDNVVDMYLNRPKKKVVARIFLSTKDKNSPILFALFNTYGVPRYLANEVVESVSSKVYTFNFVTTFVFTRVILHELMVSSILIGSTIH